MLFFVLFIAKLLASLLQSDCESIDSDVASHSAMDNGSNRSHSNMQGRIVQMRSAAFCSMSHLAETQDLAICSSVWWGGVWGGSCAPSPENFSIFELKKASFGASLVLFYCS